MDDNVLREGFGVKLSSCIRIKWISLSVIGDYEWFPRHF